ncbi:MAG: response regulator [Deltaproteobacteria bacterium]|nr:response regulator [Deltaproteobacteria bacterium]
MPDIKEKILIVDDEPSGGETVADSLRFQGYDPLVCTHPKEVLASFEKGRFRLAFVDINLPSMTGLELATKLKEIDPRIEIVFMTGYGTFDNAVEAIKIGAYDYLRKPFGMSELNLCLRRFQERQALTQRLEHSEQRYFSLVQSIPSIIFVIHDDLSLDFINSASASILGYSPKEAINDPDWIVKIIHREDRARVRGLLTSALRSKESMFSTECRLTHKEGHIIHTMMKSIPHRTESQGLPGLIVDISDRVFLERARLQDENLRILGAISEEVAHEIRNPLVSIGGFARRLKRKFPDLPEGDIILRESHRLEKMLQRITEYLRPADFTYGDCSVADVLTECLHILGPDMEREGVKGQLNLDASLSSVYADEDILTQIFTGLILNAVKEMDAGETVYIRTFEKRGNVNIEFKYRGQKTDGKYVDKALMPFGEGRQGTVLPLSSRLLRQMGGFLSYSQEPDHMVFTVSLPIRRKPVTENTGETPP